MRKPRFFAHIWIALLALAVMVAPVSGTHLHLCFDGGEAPATVHEFADSGSDHDSPGVDGSHRDADVSLLGEVASKKSDGVLDLPALLTAAIVVLRLPALAAPSPPVHGDVLPLYSRPSELLPPLRGPPV